MDDWAGIATLVIVIAFIVFVAAIALWLWR
jgi:hypothetical protein